MRPPAMPNPPILAVDELLQPLPGDDPAGDTVPFDVRQKLEEFRKEVNPSDFDPEDPLRPSEQKRADWASVEKLAIETLSTTSKDLLVAARLTEALTKQYGFAGARDGLQLLRRMVTERWDAINPKIEDGDIEVRAGPLNWLGDPDKGSRFPNTLRGVPLAEAGENAFGWAQWKLVQDGKSPLGADAFEQAVMATSAEQCQRQAEDIDQAVQELSQLDEALVAKMESGAPELFGLKQALEQCQTLAHQLLARKGGAILPEQNGASEELAGEAGGEAGADASGAPAALRRARTRGEIYRQLHELSAQLQQMEPHSPIPYLIQRACELGALPFPQLMRALIRDENIINEMSRELGIPTAGAPAPVAEAE
jgi:type VI secretion system protein ImpA